MKRQQSKNVVEQIESCKLVNDFSKTTRDAEDGREPFQMAPSVNARMDNKVLLHMETDIWKKYMCKNTILKIAYQVKRQLIMWTCPI